MVDLPDSLLAGYRTFMREHFTHETSRYRHLADKGQSPETLVIACCDSRAAPETIFNTAPGEIFVLRNVANLIPPYEPAGEYHAASAALEFAVQGLKVKNIVVMGHGRCGGIQAALDTESAPPSPGDFVGRGMGLTGPASAPRECAARSRELKTLVASGPGRGRGIKPALATDSARLPPGDFSGKWMSLIAPAAEAVSGNQLLTQSERQTALEPISIRSP